jgi:hypothetical protein
MYMSAKTRERFAELRIGPMRFNDRDVRYGCVSWQGGAFQWVQVPPGDRSKPEAAGAAMEGRNS